MQKQKIENAEELRIAQKKRRGRRRKPRMSAAEIAHVVRGAARQGHGIQDISRAMGRCKPQVVNILRAKRGVDEADHQVLREAAVLPTSGAWNCMIGDRWGWYSRVDYLPILPWTPVPEHPPQARVSIDKIVFIGRLVRGDALKTTYGQVAASPGTVGPRFWLRGERGNYPAFIERSNGDWFDPKEKNGLRYGVTLNVKVCVNWAIVTVAKLSLEPYGRGSMRDEVRLELSGLGCQLRLAPYLTQALFTPFVDPWGIELGEIHLAIDFDAPSWRLLPFQVGSGKHILNRVHSHRNAIDDIGCTYGARGEFSAAFYDKTRQVEQVRWGDAPNGKPKSRAAIIPRHAQDFGDVARLELRFRPRRMGLHMHPAAVLPKLLDRVESFRVADLGRYEAVTSESLLACEARIHGFSPRRPTLESVRTERSKAPAGERPAFNYGQHCLAQILDLGVDPFWAEEVARTLHTMTRDELVRLGERSGIDLRVIVEAAISRLQAELSATLGVDAETQMHAPFPAAGGWAA